MKRVNTFTPMESNDTVSKFVAGSSKRDGEQELNQEKPTKDKEKELWVELKRLFKPDDDDILWKLQRLSIDKSTYDLDAE
ncbi:hypothetical protein Tco_0313636 [Tanacetum coccineum]